MFLKLLLLNLMLTTHQPVDTLLTPYEKGNGNQTCTYQDCIDWYLELDRRFDNVQLQAHGTTSVGKPIHLLVIDKQKRFDYESTKRHNKAVMLINNGIHPGEPDGIDASMMLVRDLLTDKRYKGMLDDVVLLVIPTYNVSGMLNRGAYSRVNQNGPEEYGFRGNRQHLDLNRDFVKCDSKEAETFNHIFSSWRPQIFVDTHVSNGADYQYTMTYIPTHPDKLHPVLSKYHREKLISELEDRMTKAGWEMTPYVNTMREIPDDGIVAFLETPRYSTGYAALHHAIGFMPETHMLKPYKDRVQSTYDYLLQTLEIFVRDRNELVQNQQRAFEESAGQQSWNIRWELDESNVDKFKFKGYEAAYKPSEVTGEKRLYYDSTTPFEKDIAFYNTYKPSLTVTKPKAYVIPQCYPKVLELLEANGVEFELMEADTMMNVELYLLDPMDEKTRLFESKHPHQGVSVIAKKSKVQFYKGDAIVKTGQRNDRYIVETLEPQAHDSFYTWGFFDGVLSQKEHYSDYVFEDLAAQLLKDDAGLKQKFDEKKKSDTSFANNPQAQLDFIYRNSPYFESTYRQYPVMRLME